MSSRLLYRRRWQIECFFRWLKCLLGCRHWLAESQRGVTVQLYLALIAALLCQQHIGHRPSKRLLEAIQMYQLGWVSLQGIAGCSSRRATAAGSASKNLKTFSGPLRSTRSAWRSFGFKELTPSHKPRLFGALPETHP